MKLYKTFIYSLCFFKHLQRNAHYRIKNASKMRVPISINKDIYIGITKSYMMKSEFTLMQLNCILSIQHKAAIYTFSMFSRNIILFIFLFLLFPLDQVHKEANPINTNR